MGREIVESENTGFWNPGDVTKKNRDFMGFQWDFNGISMGFPWDFHGISIGFPWDL